MQSDEQLCARTCALEEALLAGDRAVADLEARLAAALLDGAARDAAGLALRLALEAAAGAAYHAVKLSGATTLTIDASHLSADQAARAAFAARLASYRFLKYRTTLKPEKTPSIGTIKIVAGDVKAAESAWAVQSAGATAVEFARDLVAEPANVLYPEEYAKRVKGLE